MADPALLQSLEYILNHSNEASLDILAEAVARRKRDLTVFNAVGGLPDPQKMAKEITEKINSGIGIGIEGMRKSVQEMIIRILREHAPELNDKQVDELCRAWLPDMPGSGKNQLPNEALLSMIEQFTAFSRGEMPEPADKKLRDEIGEWPQRYWNAFPPVIRQIIADFLKDRITAKDFKSRIVIALGI
ncbi:MAG: hypothetical protein FWC21_04170 [Treponema sp.]|nr:hypothetical protein [Treponema sp.]